MPERKYKVVGSRFEGGTYHLADSLHKRARCGAHQPKEGWRKLSEAEAATTEGLHDGCAPRERKPHRGGPGATPRLAGGTYIHPYVEQRHMHLISNYQTEHGCKTFSEALRAILDQYIFSQPA